MDTRNRNRLAIIAHHEAGHAVAALYLRQGLRDVTIRPSKDWRGMAATYPLKFATDGVFDDSLQGIHRAECRIITAYAGPIAQRAYAPRSPWRACGGGHLEPGTDFDVANDLLFRLAGSDELERNLLSKLLWRRAELLVQHRWRVIEAVAKRLLEVGRLTRREVFEIRAETLGLAPVHVAAAAQRTREA